MEQQQFAAKDLSFTFWIPHKTIQCFRTFQNSERQHPLMCKAGLLLFKDKLQIRHLSRTFIYKAVLQNPVPRPGGKMHLPFLILPSHYTQCSQTRILPGAAPLNCLLTQHPTQMGALIPNSVWWLHTTKYCYSCQRTARTPVTSFCYFHSTTVRSSYSSPIFMLMAESLPAPKGTVQH